MLITGGSGFIGTNLILQALENNFKVLNLDISRPSNDDHLEYWAKVDILDYENVISAFKDFLPEYVIHLAARIDSDERANLYDDYKVNIIGTENIINAIKATPRVRRVIITSTQFVYRNGNALPKDDLDFKPHTIYGRSKVLTEKITRESNLKCVWTIVRPTTIWGPGDLVYRSQFYKVLKNKLYFHPGHNICRRSYEFVENVAYYMLKILSVDPTKIDNKVFYLGGKPINVIDWVNEFHNQLYNRDSYVMPGIILSLLSKVGDLINVFSNKRFFIDTQRYNSMTESYPVPINQTYGILGEPPITLKEGVEKTIFSLKKNNII
jgi:GlcNAc-P-P-Und epimerase